MDYKRVGKRQIYTLTPIPVNGKITFGYGESTIRNAVISKLLHISNKV